MIVEVVNVRETNAADSELAGTLSAYLADLEAGRPVDADRLMADHPAIADRLRACLAGLRLFEQTGQAFAATPTAETAPAERSRPGSATSASSARSAGAAWAWSTRPSKSRCGGGWP